MVNRHRPGPLVDVEVKAGLGVPCAEAQADGVPCEVLRDCADCEHAEGVPEASTEHPPTGRAVRS